LKMTRATTRPIIPDDYSLGCRSRHSSVLEKKWFFVSFRHVDSTHGACTLCGWTRQLTAPG
jgi:hypothetical protein